MAAVRLPASLARLFPDLPRVTEAEGTTVGAVIAALDARHPGLRDRIVDSRPAIREHLLVFVDGERAGLSTAVPLRGEVEVVASASGG